MEIHFKETTMLLISNNCCGIWVYRFKHLQYNNPFCGMICPYHSILYIMKNWEHINWMDYAVERSTIRPNTFVVKVDKGNIEIHYVHHKEDKKLTETHTSYDTYPDGKWPYEHISNDISRIVEEKYLLRVRRMIESHEEPVFLLSPASYAKSQNVTLQDLANCDCRFKRIVISRETMKTPYPNKVKLINRRKLGIPYYRTQATMPDIETFLLKRTRIDKQEALRQKVKDGIPIEVMFFSGNIFRTEPKLPNAKLITTKDKTWILRDFLDKDGRFKTILADSVEEVRRNI